MHRATVFPARTEYRLEPGPPDGKGKVAECDPPQRTSALSSRTRQRFLRGLLRRTWTLATERRIHAAAGPRD